MMLSQAFTWLILPFYLIRLALVSLPSIIRISYPEKLHLVPLVPAVIFCGVILSQYLTAAVSPTLSASATAPSAITLEDTVNAATPQVQTTLDQEIEFWLKWYQIQPTHRDVLLNLASLFEQAGNEEQALLYLKQAQELDPNSPLVQQFLQ
jgi:tetratricopeptide (TPR) repeat protein